MIFPPKMGGKLLFKTANTYRTPPLPERHSDVLPGRRGHTDHVTYLNGSLTFVLKGNSVASKGTHGMEGATITALEALKCNQATLYISVCHSAISLGNSRPINCSIFLSGYFFVLHIRTT